ncbi:MAG: ankyrin repeat domain-containing protein, partial [Wolbachia sp.]
EQDNLLHLAAMIGEVNAVRYLIGKGVDVNVRNALHHTPLHLAAGIGHAEVVKILIREGKAEIDVFDARNQTPMHYAV